MDTSEKLSQLRQQLFIHFKEQGQLLRQLADSNTLILGSFYYVYKTCSKPNCCCQKGKRHGPFPALSQSINGKRKLKMVKLDDEIMVKKKAEEYKQFQARLKQMRRIYKEMDKILEKIRILLLEEY